MKMPLQKKVPKNVVTQNPEIDGRKDTQTNAYVTKNIFKVGVSDHQRSDHEPNPRTRWQYIFLYTKKQL